jgi:hypothetical protein
MQIIILCSFLTFLLEEIKNVQEKFLHRYEHGLDSWQYHHYDGQRKAPLPQVRLGAHFKNRGSGGRLHL